MKTCNSCKHIRQKVVNRVGNKNYYQDICRSFPTDGLHHKNVRMPYSINNCIYYDNSVPFVDGQKISPKEYMENNGLKDGDAYVVWYGDRIVSSINIVVPDRNFEIMTFDYDGEKWSRKSIELIDKKMLRFEFFSADRIRSRLKKIIDSLPESVLVMLLSETMQMEVR